MEWRGEQPAKAVVGATEGSQIGAQGIPGGQAASIWPKKMKQLASLEWSGMAGAYSQLSLEYWQEGARKASKAKFPLDCVM